MNVEKIKKLAELDSPTVANGLGLLKVQDPTAGYTGPDIRALMPDMGVRVGIAVTARLDTTTPGPDPAVAHEMWFQWLRRMQEVARGGGGETVPVFAVIEAVGPRPRFTATLGDGMATMMRLAGAVAFLSNGSIRDVDGVKQVGLPCWAAGLVTMHGKMEWLGIDVPVVIDGVRIRPGDVVHADVNGTTIIPAEVADQVYDRALAVREAEQKWFAEVRRPGLTLDEYLEGKR